MAWIGQKHSLQTQGTFLDFFFHLHKRRMLHKCSVHRREVSTWGSLPVPYSILVNKSVWLSCSSCLMTGGLNWCYHIKLVYPDKRFCGLGSVPRRLVMRGRTYIFINIFKQFLRWNNLRMLSVHFYSFAIL